MEFKDVIVIAVFIGLVVGYVYFWYKYNKCQEILHLYIKRCNLCFGTIVYICKVIPNVHPKTLDKCVIMTQRDTMQHY